MSIGSKSSVSPSDSRVLSEQSEITLDSDSKLSNSVQSKPFQSPQNSVSKTSDTSNSAHRNFGEIADDDVHKELHKKSSEPVARKEKPKFTEQDMFSEHFDVSFKYFFQISVNYCYLTASHKLFFHYC